MASKQQEVEVIESWEEIEETDVINSFYLFNFRLN
jgi:hypothetical protein